jgi:hypothetical protein
LAHAKSLGGAIHDFLGIALSPLTTLTIHPDKLGERRFGI